MIHIKTKIQKENVYKFMLDLTNLKSKLETEDTLLYSKIPLSIALKYNVVISDFLLHSMIIKKRKFYEDAFLVSNKKQLIDLIAQVLEFELSKDVKEDCMDNKNLAKLIKAHKRLSKNENSKM